MKAVQHTRHDVHGYDSAARQRMFAEQGKSVRRGDFARDRARVVHSAALRRLSGKTQVVGPGTNDFARTRLTHSLEVAQVGRELADQLGCAPDVVDAACLAHDLGHPPFGHHGEDVLNYIAEGIGGFEGNAQSFRLLTRLEHKIMVPDATGQATQSVGLNLTRATLDACTKYPWGRGENPDKPNKFGFYDDDKAAFDWMRQGAPGRRRCLEAQVMDLADDIAYCVHDVEDAIVGGWFVPSQARLPDHQEEVARIAQRFAPGRSIEDLLASFVALQRHPLWPGEFDRSPACQAQLKNFASSMIGEFAQSATLVADGEPMDSPAARYQADVDVPVHIADTMAVMKAIAVHYVMHHETRQREYAKQELILTELVDALLAVGATALEPMFAVDFDAAISPDKKLRVVIDQVSVLTDTGAQQRHAQLCRPRG